MILFCILFLELFEHRLDDRFEEFDTNNDGVVDTRELWEGCHRFGLTPDVEQIKLMVARADNGYDGTCACHVSQPFQTLAVACHNRFKS
eukprot:COSAG06_NODE_167_length_21546_cov_35.001352_17_plen_89_part_00